MQEIKLIQEILKNYEHLKQDKDFDKVKYQDFLNKLRELEEEKKKIQREKYMNGEER